MATTATLTILIVIGSAVFFMTYFMKINFDKIREDFWSSRNADVGKKVKIDEKIFYPRPGGKIRRPPVFRTDAKLYEIEQSTKS